MLCYIMGDFTIPKMERNSQLMTISIQGVNIFLDTTQKLSVLTSGVVHKREQICRGDKSKSSILCGYVCRHFLRAA